MVRELKLGRTTNLLFHFLEAFTEAYLEPCQISKMERFENSLLIFFVKRSILDAWQRPQYMFVLGQFWFPIILLTTAFISKNFIKNT